MIAAELHGHSGCVNRLAWNHDGSLLASVSDDTDLIIRKWEPAKGGPFEMCSSVHLSTGHTSNIFGVAFLTESNDTALATGAMDCARRTC